MFLFNQNYFYRWLADQHYELMEILKKKFKNLLCFRWGKEGNGYPYLYLPLNVNHEPDFCNLSYPKTCVGM